jgi:hypothetical protein
LPAKGAPTAPAQQDRCVAQPSQVLHHKSNAA